MASKFKKKFQKSYFFLNGRSFTPPPLLMGRPLREELFFAASLTNILSLTFANVNKNFKKF